jgi:hypothetical protein
MDYIKKEYLKFVAHKGYPSEYHIMSEHNPAWECWCAGMRANAETMYAKVEALRPRELFTYVITGFDINHQDAVFKVLDKVDYEKRNNERAGRIIVASTATWDEMRELFKDVKISVSERFKS